MTTDKPAGEMPDEWEEYTIRVKKDPSWPYHGTDIEFNGVRYVRAEPEKPDWYKDVEYLAHLRSPKSEPNLKPSTLHVRADKPDAAAARNALDALNELIAITEDSYSGHERAVQLGQIIKRLLQREAGQ